MQTLIKLDLRNNQILAQGAQYLGEALQKNAVRQNHSLRFHHIHLSHFIQTLKELALQHNRIRAQGAQYLGEALQKNSVSQNHSLHFRH